ncbi:hypothetical protein Patl1_02988 [Pistacia atlantica]|uniref:Uncharacterized protein n=1 Tax=Pistacia atlantica TaxID=434234 RepID=A0ACC1CAL6_9ROSI|nr:hypothetical protein Patl1_02988 [Pistacia atlantica]
MTLSSNSVVMNGNVEFSGSAKRVAVVGAGVSELATAYKLKSHGLNVMVFEAEGSAVGKLRIISQGGLIWDEGANTMVTIEVDCPLAYKIYPLGDWV